jgi:hypothetical protein
MARVVLLALVCHAGILTKQLISTAPGMQAPCSAGQLIYDNDSPVAV